MRELVSAFCVGSYPSDNFLSILPLPPLPSPFEREIRINLLFRRYCIDSVKHHLRNGTNGYNELRANEGFEKVILYTVESTSHICRRFSVQGLGSTSLERYAVRKNLKLNTDERRHFAGIVLSRNKSLEEEVKTHARARVRIFVQSRKLAERQKSDREFAFPSLSYRLHNNRARIYASIMH